MLCISCENRDTQKLILFAAAPTGVLLRDLHDHGADAVRPAQDHRVAAALVGRPHQGVPLPNTSRGQVPPLCQNHAP